MFVHFDLYSLFPKLNLISEPNFSISTESGNTYVFHYYQVIHEEVKETVKPCCLMTFGSFWELLLCL